MASKNQIRVARAVKARGYRTNWTDSQFAARQAVKLIEESAELLDHVTGLPGYFRMAVKESALMARRIFDDKIFSKELTIGAAGAVKELADCQVIIFNLADALGVDSGAEALAKAESDISRGVR